MILNSTKRQIAENSAKSAISLFTTALDKLKSSNSVAEALVTENTEKMKILSEENDEMQKLTQQNQVIVENLSKLLGIV